MAGFFFARRTASATACPAQTRLFQKDCLRASVHGQEAMFTPARLTMACISLASSPQPCAVRPSQPAAVTPCGRLDAARWGSRVSSQTLCPSASRERVRARPMRPVPPVISTFIVFPPDFDVRPLVGQV